MKDMFPKKILAFVLARRHETGGFSAAPTLPPSVEDTYLAIRVLQFLHSHLGEKIDPVIHHPDLARYLLTPVDREERHFRTAYHHLYCCRAAGVALNRDWISRFIADHSGDSMGLADRFYRTRIIKEIPGTLSEKAAPPSIDPFPMHFRTAKELWMSLGLAEGRPERLNTDRRSLLTWIRSCQNPDGGFGFLPGTTSYMENVHTCLRVLALLNAAPLDHARARQFILNAWTRSGGFARKSGGAPFLDATWHAVGSLSILEKARKRL